MNRKVLNIMSIIVLAMFIPVFSLIAAGCKNAESQEPVEAAETSKDAAPEENEVPEETAEDNLTEENVEEAEQEIEEEETFLVEYPVTIEDDWGQQEGCENRKLVFDGPAESVIVGETNFALCLKEFGKLDKVKGVEYYIPDDVPELSDSPQVIASSGVDLEGLLDLSPELLVNLMSGTLWEPAVIEQIETAGIKIYSIGNVSGLEYIKDYITEYGLMFDSVEIASRLVSEMEEKQEKVKNAVEQTAKSDNEKPEVIYCTSIASEYGDWVPGSNTFIDQLITDAGGVNLPAKQGIENWGEYSVEKFLESDPDIIIIPVSENPFYIFKSVEDFTSHEMVQELTAVKEGRVFAITGEYINNMSFTAADALVEFTEAINGISID
jgi:ABC-type Fe3+-hydroxamate transport system substrate-binding protein